MLRFYDCNSIVVEIIYVLPIYDVMILLPSNKFLLPTIKEGKYHYNFSTFSNFAIFTYSTSLYLHNLVPLKYNSLFSWETM